ncbi:MAG: cytochrome P450, partial [Pseudomonadales bacterium]|nr:cytochrome P450 [Pseudomonadales bacterium]
MSEQTASKPKVGRPTPEDFNDKPLPVDPYAVPIEEINMIDGRYFQQNRQFEFFRRLRAEDPVHLNEHPFTGRYWSITKFDDIMYVDKHHELFSSAHGIGIGPKLGLEPDPEELAVSMFIAMDPPKHDLQRATVTGVVAPSNLAKLEPVIRERAGRILDALPVGETFDWVDTVSIELTTQMLATLFDFPFEERRKLTRWSDVATAVPGSGIVDTEEERRAELIECLQYFTQLWEERKRNPGDDLVSMLAQGEDTRNMEPLEFLGNLILLIVGGNDTTRNSMSAFAWGLEQFPDQRAKLEADPSLIPNAVQELVRWQTPLAHMRRTVQEDTELDGVAMKKGDKVVLWYISANRDESVFADADKVVVDRENARRHLSFGYGIHR